MLTKEMFTARKELTRAGDFITADCSVLFAVKGAPGSDLPEIKRRIDALAAKVAQAAEIVRRAKQRA